MIDSVHIIPPGGDPLDTRHRVRDVLSQPWLPFVLAFLFIGMDVFSGPYIQFPVTFVIPVALAAWYGSFRNAALLAVFQPLLNLLIAVMTKTAPVGIPVSMFAMNSGIRIVVLLVLAYFIHRSAMQSRELARRVGLLRSNIPMCFECKKVLDEHSDWTPVDVYVARHTGANITNNLCPGCRSALVGKEEKA